MISVPVGADAFTTDRWLLGPSAVVLKQQGPWTYGTLVNHVWDVGGPGDADVSATFIQPFCAWGGLGGGRTLTLNSESTYDWNAEQWTVPVNAMFTKVSKIGSQLVSYQVGARVYLDAPSGGPDWGLRAAITFLFPR